MGIKTKGSKEHSLQHTENTACLLSAYFHIFCVSQGLSQSWFGLQGFENSFLSSSWLYYNHSLHLPFEVFCHQGHREPGKSSTFSMPAQRRVSTNHFSIPDATDNFTYEFRINPLVNLLTPCQTPNRFFTIHDEWFPMRVWCMWGQTSMHSDKPMERSTPHKLKNIGWIIPWRARLAWGCVWKKG